MSAANEATGTETLSTLFDKGLRLYNELCDTLEPSNSKEYQDKAKMAVYILEDATRLVSSLGLFSDNETVDEVATSDLKFFLLPVLLGDLVLKIHSDDRLRTLTTAEIYFNDFLKRCRQYKTTPDVRIPDEDEVVDGEETAGAVVARPGPPSFEEMARQREAKIRKFQAQKTLEGRIRELKGVVDAAGAGAGDETAAREYHLLLLEKFVRSTLDEAAALRQERPIVEHMARLKATGGAAALKSPPRKPSKPFQPIIITRDAFQKKVYGLGYPSIPAMTVEELVEQRIKDGWYDNLGGSAGKALSLHDQARNAELALQRQEQEETDKERQIETDAEEYLVRARRMDEWKDDHRRGEGNRHNMG